MFFSSAYLAPYIAVLMKRKELFLVTAFVVMTLGTIVTYCVPKKYEAACTVFIEKSVITQLVQGIAITPSMDDSMRVLTSVLRSRALILKVLQNININLQGRSEVEIEQLITMYQANTLIKYANKDQFRVAFKHTDPVLARDYVNTLVRLYIEAETSSKKAASSDANAFLNEQIAEQNKKMAEIEAEVSQFKNSKRAEITLDAGQLFREISQAQQKLFDLQLRRKQLEEERKYVVSATDPSRMKLAALVKRLDELRAQYTESYPEIVNVKSQIEALEEELKGQKIPHSQLMVSREVWKIDAELRAIQENEASVRRHMAENKDLLASIPSSKNLLEKLEATRATQKSTHDLLAMRNNQVEMSMQMGLQEIGAKFKVIDPAITPLKPVSPNRKKLLMLSIIAGLAGGAGLLMLFEKLDNTVKLVDSLKPLGIPIMAVIPLIKSIEEVQEERHHDMKIALVSGAYFSLILLVVMMELFGIGLFENIIIKLHLPQLLSPFLKG